METETIAEDFACNTRPYAIQSVHGRGQGLVAISKITKGTRILAESPIFKVSRCTSDLQALDKVIAEQLRMLDRDQQRAFFGLYNAHGKRHSPLLGIARTNVLPLGSEAREGGLFLIASRINHSCRNNAQNTWNENIGCITIYAVQDIEPGQEITITYLAQAAPYTERQRYLKDKFFFDCACALCSLRPDQLEESDGRQEMIRFLDEAIGSFGRTGDVEEGLGAVRQMLRLLSEEGINDSSVPRAYYDAFQIAIANGDKARAKIFAERAHAARTITEGLDSPETSKLKRFSERPERHHSYRRAKDALSTTNSTTPVNVESLEDWLWMQGEWSVQAAEEHDG